MIQEMPVDSTRYTAVEKGRSLSLLVTREPGAVLYTANCGIDIGISNFTIGFALCSVDNGLLITSLEGKPVYPSIGFAGTVNEELVDGIRDYLFSKSGFECGCEVELPLVIQQSVDYVLSPYENLLGGCSV